MGFTTPTFLFIFFPVFLVLYHISEYFFERGNVFFSKLRISDVLIIAFSLLFYSWAGVSDVARLSVFILILYLAGKSEEYLISMKKGKHGIVVCSVAVAFVLLILVFTKYGGIVTSIVGRFLPSLTGRISVMMPLGVSFIAFSAISYLVDIYKENAGAGSLIDCALYISFFPKVISGPIVLWKNYERQIGNRHITSESLVDGINHVCLGFGKKVLLADILGQYAFDLSGYSFGPAAAWLSALLYMMQIYYDFAGYSDIAIGISKLIGFDFEANFNFPYISKSVSEFWRRWHISLGSWFREYLYIPMGGNRKGFGRTLLNLFTVFLLTGIWHGSGISYLLWGVANGILVIIERTVRDKKIYNKVPGFIKWAFTMFFVMMSWQLFRGTSLKANLLVYLYMLGYPLHFGEETNLAMSFYLDRRCFVLLAVAIIGATLLSSSKLKSLWIKFSSTKSGFIIQELGLLAIMALSVIVLASSSYSPFIYFQY